VRDSHCWMGRCVWLCDFSLLFFLRSLYGLLVCAEGCTQVTGVVAMMMTGRVLLVCALCVLWCGAVFGHAMDDYCGGGGGNVLRHTSNGGSDGVSLKTDCGLLRTRMGLIKAVEASEGELSVDDPNPPDKSKGTPLNNVKDDGVGGLGGIGGVAGLAAAATLVPPKPEGSDTGEQGKTVVVDTEGARHTEDTKNESGTNLQKSKIDDSSSSPPGSPATKGVKEPALKNNSGGNQPSEDKEKEEEEEEDRLSKSDSREAVVEEETKELKKDHTSHEAPVEIHGSPATDAGIQPQAPTSQVNGPSSPEELRSVQQPQVVHSELDPNNNSQRGSGTPITVNQHNEPSADHAELKPPSPTANGDAANNDADKSTEEGAPINRPVADGAGAREVKQKKIKNPLRRKRQSKPQL
ncbi:mucin-associated surface protein (MASP), putative, partial [Trypanosoma cruzi marinkellei]